MYNKDSKKKSKKLSTISRSASICLFCLTFSLNGHAGVLKLESGVESAVNVSDNINLSAADPRSDIVVQLQPQISLKSKTPRSQVQLDYSLQNLNYLRTTENNTIYHQLASTANAEFIRDIFSVNAQVSRSQFSRNPGSKASFSNFAISDRRNLTRGSVAPKLNLHYLDVAEGRIEYQAGYVALDNVASSSNIRTLNAHLYSGKAFSRFKWDTTYRKTREFREDPSLPDINFREAKARAYLGLFRNFYLVSEFGSFESDYVNSRFTVKNGRYTSYGFRWNPTRRFDIAAVTGKDFKSAQLRVAPSPRTAFRANWQKNEFGQGIGDNASAVFSLKLRHVSWNLSYSDRVTSIQQLILGQDANNANLQTYQLTDALFQQKQTSLKAARKGKKVEAGIKFFIDKREYELPQSGALAGVAGVETDLKWRLDGRLSLVARSHNEYRKTEKDIDAGRLDFFKIGLELEKRRHISAGLGYYYTAQSDLLGTTGSYLENSILLRATYTQ